MSERQRPHLVWTAAVLAGVLGLGGAAYWAWSGTEEVDPSGGPGGSGAPTPRADPADAARAAIVRAIEDERFDEATRLLADVQKRFGASDETEAVASRLQLRSRAYRADLRPIEFRVESYDSARGFDVLFARVSLGDQVVFETEDLVNSFGLGSERRRANLFTLRTSLNRGATIELVEPGGIISSASVVFGPVDLAPLPHVDGGLLEFEDPDAPITRLVVGYRMSPYHPGLHPDVEVGKPATDARAPALVNAITAALAGDRIEHARALHARLVQVAPNHPDADFVGERIDEREEALNRNRQTVRFIVVEAACDPRPDGRPWGKGGGAPAFRAKFEADGAVCATASGGATAQYLIPGETLNPPRGNVLSVSARGDAALRFKIVDTSPTFRSTEVGAVDLPITLAQLPRGTGTLVVEREPAVLVLPEDEENRLRRLVLRWIVER